MAERRPRTRTRPRIAVVKLASCDGCQLSLLDLEDELLELAGAVDLACFPEASRRMLRGPYDLTLVEGSITTPHDQERIKEVRARTRVLVTIGACATAGGIQALRNFADAGALVGAVYAMPSYVDTLATSTAVADHVAVDFQLQGCPVDRWQLLEVVKAFAAGRRPRIPAHAVCLDCKVAGNVCVTVAHGTPCLGPVTHAGCGGPRHGAICPSFARGCYGCFGPSEAPATPALAEVLRSAGQTPGEIQRAFRTFNANAPAFREEAERHGSQE